MEARPYLSVIAVWNAFDFGSESRGESFPHLNQKGLFTFDRKPKDISYLYKAHFSREPVLYVATRDLRLLTENRNVDVYTNLENIELFLNGRSLGAKPAGGAHHLSWAVPLQNGVNVIEARGRRDGKAITDRVELQLVPRPAVLTSLSTQFSQLAINVGANAQFIDGEIVWEADRAYDPKFGWGYEGGTAEKTDRNVIGTDKDPLYRTFRKGLRAYRFDLPDGRYEVELLFVEPQQTRMGERVFDIGANGQKLVAGLDLAKDAGLLRAVSRSLQLEVVSGKGIELEFKALSGDAVLSGIRLRRLP